MYFTTIPCAGFILNPCIKKKKKKRQDEAHMPKAYFIKIYYSMKSDNSLLDHFSQLSQDPDGEGEQCH